MKYPAQLGVVHGTGWLDEGPSGRTTGGSFFFEAKDAETVARFQRVRDQRVEFIGKMIRTDDEVVDIRIPVLISSVKGPTASGLYRAEICVAAEVSFLR